MPRLLLKMEDGTEGFAGWARLLSFEPDKKPEPEAWVKILGVVVAAEDEDQAVGLSAEAEVAVVVGVAATCPKRLVV